MLTRAWKEGYDAALAHWIAGEGPGPVNPYMPLSDDWEQWGTGWQKASDFYLMHMSK